MRGNYLQPWSNLTATTQLFSPSPYHLACIIPFFSLLYVVGSTLGAAQSFKPTSHVCATPPPTPPIAHSLTALCFVVVNGTFRVAGREKYAARRGVERVTWRLKEKRELGGGVAQCGVVTIDGRGTFKGNCLQHFSVLGVTLRLGLISHF